MPVLNESKNSDFHVVRGFTWFPEEGDEHHDEGQACQDADYYRKGPPDVILRIILSPKQDQTKKRPRINEKGFGADGHQCSLHFQNFNFFKISHFYVSKNYEVKYIDRYIQDECMQKSPVKNTLYFGKYK
jgi:hypothetical protein